MSLDYLFIRLLEACNGNCFMCRFAGSRDPFALAAEDLERILRSCQQEGVKYIRFTGGEPLLSRDLIPFIRRVKQLNMKSSVISNGLLLPLLMEDLAEAGLDQVIVSIDSPFAWIHNRFRKTPNLFENGIEGLKIAAKSGVKTRVNTVCGKHNIEDMARLQDLLTELEVKQWELSTIKFVDKVIRYSPAEVEKVDAMNRLIYNARDKLVPMGVPWSGENEESRRLFFRKGIAPRPLGRCHIVNKIRYLDAKNKKLYICSLNPHRAGKETQPEEFADYTRFTLSGEKTRENACYFYSHGPKVCTGCSATAAGVSNVIDSSLPLEDWYY